MHVLSLKEGIYEGLKIKTATRITQCDLFQTSGVDYNDGNKGFENHENNNDSNYNDSNKYDGDDGLFFFAPVTIVSFCMLEI